jgi:hypothetical protein
MTRSPFLVVITKSFVRLYCSATSGDMFALNKPVPIPSRQKAGVYESLGNKPKPIMTRARAKAPIALSCSITPGTAETMSTMCPISAITTATQMVLNRPQ